VSAVCPAPTHLVPVSPGSSRPACLSCLYCSGHDLRPAYTGVRDRLGFVPGEREFWKCRGCGSLVLVPLPRSQDLAAFYPPVYTFGTDLGGASRFKRLLTWLEYAAFFRPQYRGQAGAVLAGIAKAPPPHRRLLDLGCGRGMRLLEFRARGWDVHGTDFAPDAVRYLRECHGIPAVCTDVAGVADHFPPESFDLVTAFHLFEHLPDVAGAFAACFALLKPGGWLAVAAPLADTPGLRWFGRRWVSLAEAPRHVSIPSTRGLLRAAGAAGFCDGRVVADQLLNCAAVYALSAVPAATTTATTGKGFLGALWGRLRGGVGLIAGFLGRAVEATTGAVPPCGILLARKPTHGGTP